MDKQWIKEVESLSLREQWKKLYDRKIKYSYVGLWGKGTNLNKKYGLLSAELPNIFKELNIKTFLDCGCGNFFWLNKIKWNGVNYLGVDIVPELIESNKKNYPDFKFDCVNIVEEEIPTVDMVFVRSVFIHLENKDIIKALANIKRSGSKYLMATTSPNMPDNVDTKYLMLRKRSLTKPPFNLPNPLRYVKEHYEEQLNSFTCMGIWEVSKL